MVELLWEEAQGEFRWIATLFSIHLSVPITLHVFQESILTLYGKKNSLLARRKLERFPYLQYSTITMRGPDQIKDRGLETGMKDSEDKPITAITQ